MDERIFVCIGKLINGKRALIICGWNNSQAIHLHNTLRLKLNKRQCAAAPSLATLYFEENGDHYIKAVWVVFESSQGKFEPLGSRSPRDIGGWQKTRTSNALKPVKGAALMPSPSGITRS